MTRRAAAALALAALLSLTACAGAPRPPAQAPDPRAPGILEAHIREHAAREAEDGSPRPPAPPIAPLRAPEPEEPAIWQTAQRLLEILLIPLALPIVLLTWLLGGSLC